MPRSSLVAGASRRSSARRRWRSATDASSWATRVLAAGDIITIDGSSGEVFEGEIPGVDRGRARGADAARVGRASSGSRSATRPPDDGPSASGTAAERRRSDRRTTRWQGHAGPMPPGHRDQGVRAGRRRRRRRPLDARDDVQPILDQLAIDGLTATTAGALPTDRDGHGAGGHARWRPSATAWGADAAHAALDAFLDARPPDEGHRHRVAAPRRSRGPGPQRPHRRRLRRRGPRTAQRPCTPMRSRGSTPLETGCPRLADYGVRLEPRGASGTAPATAGTWRHRASTATTASGSSSTRTSSSSPAAAARTKSPSGAHRRPRRLLGDQRHLAATRCHGDARRQRREAARPLVCRQTAPGQVRQVGSLWPMGGPPKTRGRRWIRIERPPSSRERSSSSRRSRT